MKWTLNTIPAYSIFIYNNEKWAKIGNVNFNEDKAICRCRNVNTNLYTDDISIDEEVQLIIVDPNAIKYYNILDKMYDNENFNKTIELLKLKPYYDAFYTMYLENTNITNYYYHLKKAKFYIINDLLYFEDTFFEISIDLNEEEKEFNKEAKIYEDDRKHIMLRVKDIYKYLKQDKWKDLHPKINTIDLTKKSIKITNAAYISIRY